MANNGYLAYRLKGALIRANDKIKHYCPVCYKEIPESAYGKTHRGCIEMNNLSADGWVYTGQGTIRLGEKPGEFESVYPKKIFTDFYSAIRARQETGSVRIGRCK